MKSSAPSDPSSWKVGIIIAIAVPAVLFLTLEGLCRIAHLDERWKPASASPQALDMPTWMLREDNVRARLDVQKVDKDALEWMNLFEEGEGFRVRMRPNVERAIVNTFSRLPSDRQNRYTIRANSLGFRGPELTLPKPAGTFRILVFGDSSAFGWGVEQDQMFSEQLRSVLQAHVQQSHSGQVKTIEVGNFAIPGDSSEYGRLIFDRFAAQYDPDLIILGFGANDAKKVLTPHRRQVEAFSSSRTIFAARKLINQSALVRTLANAGAALSKPPPKRDPSELLPTNLPRAVSRKRFSANLAEMAKAARASNNAQTLLLTLCTPATYRTAARKTAERNHLIFADGQKQLLLSIPDLKSGKLYQNEVQQLRNTAGPALSHDDLYFVSSDGCHPNAIGHQIVAAQLAQTILAAGVL